MSYYGILHYAVCTNTRVCMYVYMYVFWQTCLMYACVYACIYVCIGTYVCKNASIYLSRYA